MFLGPETIAGYLGRFRYIGIFRAVLFLGPETIAGYLGRFRNIGQIAKKLKGNNWKKTRQVTRGTRIPYPPRICVPRASGGFSDSWGGAGGGNCTGGAKMCSRSPDSLPRFFPILALQLFYNRPNTLHNRSCPTTRRVFRKLCVSWDSFSAATFAQPSTVRGTVMGFEWRSVTRQTEGPTGPRAPTGAGNEIPVPLLNQFHAPNRKDPYRQTSRRKDRHIAVANSNHSPPASGARA